MPQARITDDGLNVILEINGKATSLPYQAAKDIGRELLRIALMCEERANAAGLINDQAILIRAGFPIGIANDRKILKEAAKKAEDIVIPGIPKPKEVRVGSLIIK
jgi:hypothetical protein